MQIVELGDNSMVIMKDSEDPPWVSVGNVYRHALNRKVNIVVGIHDSGPFQEASESICTGGRLLLFFKDHIKPEFQLHSKVSLFC